MVSSSLSIEPSLFAQLLTASSLTSSSPNLDADNDPFPFLADILGQPSEPIFPIWEVQLQLSQRRGKSRKKQTKETDPPFEVSISPSLIDFQEAFEKLLDLYEHVITSFVPISEDERISVFTTPSRFDLLVMIAEEKTERPDVRPCGFLWPDVTTLLHDYGPYKECVTFMRNVLGATMNEIQRFSKVSVGNFGGTHHILHFII